MAHGLLLLGSGLVRREGCRVNNILGLSTVHRLIHLTQQILGPARSIGPRHTLVSKYTDLKGQETPQSANSKPSSVQVMVHLVSKFSTVQTHNSVHLALGLYILLIKS